MKEQEEELTRHIKALFEDVDDGLSEQGWAELRKKYPEAPSRKMPIWWLSGVAASILVVAGLFLFLQKSPQPADQTNPIGKTQNTEVPKTADQNPATTPQTLDATPVPNDNLKTDIAVVGQQNRATQQNPMPNTTAVPTLIATVGKADTTVKFASPAQVAIVLPQQQVAANPPAVVAQPNQQIAANPPVIANASEQPASKAKEPAPVKKTTEEFLNDQSRLMAGKEQNEEKGREIKNSFDVFTGTFVNYAANNTAKINAGFGVNANIKVAQNVVLSFGAGLSQNRVSYGNNSRVPDNLAYDVSSSAMAYNVVSRESQISDIRANAQLLAIDIPITVKIYPGKKKNFYVSTGINSNSYLLQRYTYDYTVQNTAGFVKSVPVQEQTEESKFKGFDFANSAIFAVGLSQSIGKNTIIFEPYFKPSIGSMGDKNLKINSAGINLRFNFTGKKK